MRRAVIRFPQFETRFSKSVLTVEELETGDGAMGIEWQSNHGMD